METTEKTVAQIILEQLGGNKFRVMTGASNFGSMDNHLSFKIGQNPKGITHVQIALTSEDLYDMDFYRIRKHECKKIAWTHGIFNSDLQEVFRNTTGLATHL